MMAPSRPSSMNSVAANNSVASVIAASRTMPAHHAAPVASAEVLAPNDFALRPSQAPIGPLATPTTAA